MADFSLRQELARLIPSPRARWAWLVVAIVFATFYWPSLKHLVGVWRGQEDYNHGFFVPLFALFLLWHRRNLMPQATNYGNLWGLPLFALWALMRWTADYFNYGSFTEFSMLPFFAGMTLFVGGWQGMRWAWPSILFLSFMLPLPGVVEDFSREQLQFLATKLSVYTIQTLGIAATADGVVIQLAHQALQVEEACSGLRMMMLFSAICLGAAFVVRKPLWEKLVMIASAVPIAIAANVLRIVLTAVLCEFARQWPSLFNEETAGKFMHGMAGLFMMPIGMGLLFVEMAILSRLMISDDSDRPLLVARTLAGSRVETVSQQGLPGQGLPGQGPR